MIRWSNTRALCIGACVVALGMLLSSCDRCGDWWWAPDQSQSCKGNAPR